MVSLRRRRLLGLSDGHCQRPLLNWDEGIAHEILTHNSERNNVQPIPRDDVSQLHKETIGKVEPGTGSSSSKELNEELFPGIVIKHRKKHRRKNSEAWVMRGVYFKNMKWQAAIKVDKKQIHLGTVSSQEEAARLYDRAAFMCGRVPNMELPEQEKQQLRKFKWDEFLAMTRNSISNKKRGRRIGAGPEKGSEPAQEANGFFNSEQVDPDVLVS